MDFLIKMSQAFQHGGIWMYFIMALQVASLAIVIERAYVLYFKFKPNQAPLLSSIEDNIRRGEMDQVLQKSQAVAKSNALAEVVQAGAQAASHFGGKDEIQGKMDEILLVKNSEIEKRIGFLSMIANVATLTGLLGTITGMIKSFAAVSQANPAEKAALLSAGISEAMSATAYGLIVAIPALVAFAILQNRANNLSESLNQSALKVFNWLSYAFDPVSLRNSVKMNPTRVESRDLNT
jgi:biopolymer transport protein ExbB